MNFNSSVFDIWMKIFTPNIVKMLVHQTNLYINRDKNYKKFSVNDSEIHIFLKTTLISGYHVLSQETTIGLWSKILAFQ